MTYCVYIKSKLNQIYFPSQTEKQILCIDEVPVIHLCFSEDLPQMPFLLASLVNTKRSSQIHQSFKVG